MNACHFTQWSTHEVFVILLADRAEFGDFKIDIVTDSDNCLLTCCACNWRLVQRGCANLVPQPPDVVSFVCSSCEHW